MADDYLQDILDKFGVNLDVDGGKQTQAGAIDEFLGGFGYNLGDASSPKPTAPLTLNNMTRIVESPGYIKEYIKDRKAFFPTVDFSDPASFAKFGLAEEYYKKSIENIYKTYPYDGSLKEKIQWHNEASYIDNYIFDAEYPRTNGYVNIGFPWGSVSSVKGDYKLSSTPQYISFKGGPHAASIPAYSGQSYTKEITYKEEEQKANIYNATSSQIQNMTINGAAGNTVEFWFKCQTDPSKAEVSDQPSKNFAYFDLWNEQTIGSVVPGSEYGRFLIETKLNSSNQYQELCMFNVTYRSGSSGVDFAKLGGEGTVATAGHVKDKFGIDLSEWNHYAFSVKNSTDSNQLVIKLYINGNLVDTVHTGSQVGEVKEGPFNANLGAYRTKVHAGGAAITDGFGSISGSFDEFRFWTNQRTSEEIKIFHRSHVGGGTNTDYGNFMSKYSGSVNPVDLGVYYKFNEGIVGNSDSDKVVLDYSGRVTNGLFNNYASTCRSTSSAIVESSASAHEFKDPIIYSFHPTVVSYKDKSTQKGKEYDDRNTMGIYYSLPGWILDEDSDKSNFTIKNLTQIIASYFDDLYLQARQMPEFRHNTYPSGSITGSFVQKPLPFADKLLSNMGFVAPEIFTDVDEIAEFMNRDEHMLFEEKLYDIRNQIYYNIYNNLNFINKSKGTEKAIRNLIHCFGVNDDIYSVNFYANNAKLDLRRAAQLKGAKKTYADFSVAENFGATVFQNTASSNSNSVSFITASNIAGGLVDHNAWDREFPFTMEAEVIFPSKPGERDPNYETRFFPHLTASLFGMHTALVSPSNLTPSSDDDELTWAANDFANFQVYAVRDKVKTPNSSIVKFVLTGSNVNSTTQSIFPELTSSFFDGVYDNQKWNFSVKFKPKKYPNIGKLSGSEATDYIVEWRGYNLVGDIVQNEFYLTASISEANGLNIVKSKKRIYAGSHRTNFTGSLLHPTDVKISSCRFWVNDLSKEELLFHALDPKNYGVFNSMQNSFLLRDAGSSQATGFIEAILDDASIPTALDTNTITIVDAAGLSKTYKFMNGGGKSNGDLDGGAVVIQISGENTKEGLADNIEQAIDSANGHNGSIITTRSGAKLFLGQAVPGISGNTTITLSAGINTTTELSKSDFVNGENERIEVPKLKTLVLNWDFETLSGSDVGEYQGEFSAIDVSSGSSDDRYGPKLSALFEKQHTARGAYFKNQNNYTGSFSRETVYGLRQQVPENLNSSEAVKVLSRDDELFTPSTRPINFMFSIEKSMYQSVSEEMMNFLAAAIDSTELETLIGEPVNRYRMDYKGLEKIRNIFFDKVGNVPDVDRYISYFKWLDSSVSTMILNTIPASSDFSKISNVIESHVFERNKYWNKFPTIERKEPGEEPKTAVFFFSTNETKEVTNRDSSGRLIFGLISDAMKSKERRTKWSQFHHPIDDNSSNLRNQVNFWQYKADRSESALTSGDATVDRLRNNIREVLGETSKVGLTADVGGNISIPETSKGNSFDINQLPADLSFNMNVNRSRPKHGINKKGFVFAALKPGNSSNITFKASSFQPSKDYDWDSLYPSRKYKPEFKLTLTDNEDFAVSGRTYSPYAFYSASIPTSQIPGFQVTSQHHRDYYLSNKDVPMQGPFTEKHVGGNSYRHVGLHLGIGQGFHVKDAGWTLLTTAAGSDINFVIYNPFNVPVPGAVNYPRATLLRDETAKRPVNIKNIKSTTSSSISTQTTLPPFDINGNVKDYVGNYSKDYQILATSGRDVNNRYLVRSGSISTASIPSTGTPSVSGAYDWAIPNRGRTEHVFVSNFSSPGGPEVNGAAFKDYTSNIYSVYNALPFRNLSVRQPLRTLLTKHSVFGGYDSVFGNGIAATATITGILDSASIPTALDTNTIVIVNAVGLSKTYKFMNGGGKSNGDLDGGAVVIQLSGENTKEGLVDNIEQAIESANGHNGSIIVSRAGAVLTLTQETVGTAGNTTITFSAGINTTTELSKTNFSRGLDRLPAYYKVNRNSARRIETSDIFNTYVTGTVHDNYFVQHMIPQSDMRYLWISSSFIGGKSEIFGYQKPDFTEKSFAATDISFVSGSITGSQNAAGRLIETDFAGLNSVIVGETEISGANPNTLSFTSNTDLYASGRQLSSFLSGALVLNAINSHRGGSSLLSSWKNSSLHCHPVARELRKNNIVSLVKEKITVAPGSTKNYIVTKDIEHFTEPPVSFKYKPLEHEMVMSDGSFVYLDSTYANSMANFANKKINILTDYHPDKDNKTVYNDIKEIYIDKKIPEEYLPFESIKSLSYKEAVYPREVNTGLAKTRGRENYTVSSGSSDFNLRLGDSLAFWKDNINDRLRSDAEARNAQGLIITSGSSYFGLTDMSIWPLDSEEPFFDLYLISSSAGENGKYDPFYWAPLEPSSALKGLDPANVPRLANVNKNGELSYAGYIYGLFGINIQGKIRAEGALSASGPFSSFLGDGNPSREPGLNFKPTASFQYEFPNMMMSGSLRRVTPIEGTTNFVTGFKPTASLHLIAPYRSDVLSGKSPWFNSYEDYSDDIRRMAKDYTVLPEFRISDHMEYYLKEGFFSDNNKFLSLVGSSLNVSSSATNESGSFQADFFKIYSHSDFMKHFSVIQEDHKKNDTAFVSKIRLEANAVKKLLPYQGFYPALRSVQLGHLFSSSYAPFISGSNVRDGDQERLAALYQPFFAPGVFFNTIKSGIAVQYPVHTGSMPSLAQATDELRLQMPTSASVYISSFYDTAPNYAFPFEAILDPDQYLPLSSSLTSSALNLSSSVYLVYPNFTGSWVATKTDGFYAAQTVDSPYTTTRNQPQMFFEWKGQSDPKYSLAASNFFAESVDFFLDQGTLTSFISKAEKDFKSMVSGSTYYMDVLLYKTDDFVSYEGPPSGTFNYDAGKEYFDAQTADDRNLFIARSGDGLLNLGISARGMHYGPAYTTHGLTFGSTGTGSVPFASYRVQDPAYAPHTPPYFYGTSRARIAFRPDKVRDMASGEAAKFTLEEILSNARIETEYENENERSRTLQENSYRNHYAAGIAQMQISSSVNLFGQMTLKEVQYDTERNPDGTFKARGATTPVVQGTNDAWIIETKFECPSVNLAHMDTASLGAGIGSGKEKYHTRGVWKGYGVIPSGSEGLFLQLKESYPQVTNDIGGATSRELTGSLIDVCGFKASKERVGGIRSKKEICEAIIAVPIDEKGNFYHIDKDMYNKQKSNYEKNNKALMAGDFGVEKDIGETSITQMIEKMKKFSLPPQMDFLNNPNVDPFVMYIFEFKHLLGKQDLADIWQNLMPDISRVAEKDTSAVEHEIGVNYEFFGQYKRGELPKNIRWMVFKAKQKARNNYFNVTQQSEVAKGFTFTALSELRGVASNPEAELTYSYNWPYDFFSLVELAQIESEVTFESPKERVEVEEIDKKTNERTRKVILQDRTRR